MVRSAMTGKKQTNEKHIQAKVHGKATLEQVLRHLGSLSIDLDDEEIEIESTYPDQSNAFGSGNFQYSRTLDLEDHPKVREAVKALVSLCQEALLQGDEEYDPDRCDRCVKSDCCRIDRIHLTEEERVRILDHLGLEDTKENSAKYFRTDDDLGGFYKSIMRHVDGGCVFLKPVDGMARCSIYDARPQVCRDYDAGYCTEYSKLLPRRAPLQV